MASLSLSIPAQSTSTTQIAAYPVHLGGLHRITQGKRQQQIYWFMRDSMTVRNSRKLQFVFVLSSHETKLRPKTIIQQCAWKHKTKAMEVNVTQ